MSLSSGSPEPIRRQPGQWFTLPDCKRVLVVIHTLVYGLRLQDLLVLFGSDLRVNVNFTVAPHAFNDGVTEFLRELGASVLPWEDAVRTEFDLVLAAGSQGIEQLHGPLVRLPHGPGQIKLTRPVDSDSRPAEGGARSVGGLGRGFLTWDGKVVPTSIALTHQDELTTLADSCPEALPMAQVVGDATYDRIAAGLPHRDAYRQALGLRDGERFVLVCSTWGLGSSFNRLDSLLPRLLAELPGTGYRTALLVHPNVHSWHGSWQIRAWLGDGAAGQLPLIPPSADWRPLLIAADFIIGDHGSVTLYGAMTDAPIIIARYPYRDINPDSPITQLARTAPALSPTRPLLEQLGYAAEEYRREPYREIAARISSAPGEFNRNMRRLLYRILGLGEPAYPPATEPLQLPAPLAAHLRSHR